MRTDTLSRLLEGLRQLPSGHHKLPRDTVIKSQRNRLLQATMEVVADRGYPDTAVADIIRHAGISRRTFYELFRDKEDCFLAAFQIAHEALVAHILNATAEHNDWQSQFDAAFAAYLEFLNDEPALSRLFLVEAHAAGARIAGERNKAHERFCRMIGALYKRAMEEAAIDAVPPAICIKGLVGGVNELAAGWIREGRYQRLAELKPALLYMTFSLISAAQAEPYREAAERLGNDPIAV